VLARMMSLDPGKPFEDRYAPRNNEKPQGENLIGRCTCSLPLVTVKRNGTSSRKHGVLP
jgi:hypothetical protein